MTVGGLMSRFFNEFFKSILDVSFDSHLSFYKANFNSIFQYKTFAVLSKKKID